MNRKHLIAILIPVFILLGMTVLPLKTLFWGTEIILETRPVDPTDLFRGDYVILSYKIEEIDMDMVDTALQQKLTEMSFPYNKELYVVLKQENDVYVADVVSEAKPLNSHLYLKAYFRYVITEPFRDSSEKPKVVVSYNIDKYFVPENTGTQLEDAARKGDLLTKVKISNGYAMLTEVYPRD